MLCGNQEKRVSNSQLHYRECTVKENASEMILYNCMQVKTSWDFFLLFLDFMQLLSPNEKNVLFSSKRECLGVTTFKKFESWHKLPRKKTGKFECIWSELDIQLSDQMVKLNLKPHLI